MSDHAHILFDDQVSGTVRVYNRPSDIITAWTEDEARQAFSKIQSYLDSGYYVAGFCAYELGHIFEDKLRAIIPDNPDLPLLRFGIFKSFQTVSESLFNPCAQPPSLSLNPAWSEAEYLKQFERVIGYIRAGDVYQINLTFPMTGEYDGTGIDLYTCLRKRQPGQFGGVLSFSDFDLVSLSPELFFRTENRTINLRPMKGTAKRLSDQDADLALKNAMRADDKSRAENLMIVDLLRNDVSRLAEKGSVRVPELFALETYPTLHQMTSRIEARLRKDVSVEDLFRSLFPCGSVTGAPKIRAMEIIQELEARPRGAYCGAIGFIDPSGESCFNVAIRTFTLKNRHISYPVGSGVVLDSDGPSEYAECLLKAEVTRPSRPRLIETLKYEQKSGSVRSNLHLDRMEGSARELGYPFDREAAEARLQDIRSEHDLRLRLGLTSSGEFDVETQVLTPLSLPVKLSLCAEPLSLEVQEYRHKWDRRDFYDGQRKRIQALTGCDEILFLNAQGELCEGSFTTVFIEALGTMFTPHRSSGQLPGILRQDLLDRGKVDEVVLTIDDLINADAIWVGNSLRGLMRAELLSTDRL